MDNQQGGRGCLEVWAWVPGLRFSHAACQSYKNVPILCTQWNFPFEIKTDLRGAWLISQLRVCLLLKS